MRKPTAGEQAQSRADREEAANMALWNRINEARTRNGLSPVKWDSEYAKKARTIAERYIANNADSPYQEGDFVFGERTGAMFYQMYPGFDVESLPASVIVGDFMANADLRPSILGVSAAYLGAAVVANPVNGGSAVVVFSSAKALSPSPVNPAPVPTTVVPAPAPSTTVVPAPAPSTTVVPAPAPSTTVVPAPNPPAQPLTDECQYPVAGSKIDLLVDCPGLRNVTPAEQAQARAQRLDAAKAAVLEQINHVREHYGLPRFELDSNLETNAQQMADDYSKGKVWQRPKGLYAPSYRTGAGMSYGYTFGPESVAPFVPVSSALKNDKVRSWLLNPNYTHIGVGLISTDTFNYYGFLFQ